MNVRLEAGPSALRYRTHGLGESMDLHEAEFTVEGDVHVRKGAWARSARPEAVYVANFGHEIEDQGGQTLSLFRVQAAGITAGHGVIVAGIH